MKQIKEICEKYKVALCYIFGSQQEIGISLLDRERVEMKDAESDIDFAVLFETPPLNSLETYACLSVDLQDLVSLLKQTCFFCTRLTISFSLRP